LRRNRRNRASSRGRVSRGRSRGGNKGYKTQRRWVHLEKHTEVSINTLKYKQLRLTETGAT
jgi:hypothetical protein